MLDPFLGAGTTALAAEQLGRDWVGVEINPDFATPGGTCGVKVLGVAPGANVDVMKVFGSNKWKIVDTGGGLRRWQVDLYWGEDEPLGPGRLMARPRGTEFEYAYSNATAR